MKFAKKHKTLFYVPGMISLVLLPVLLMWFVKMNKGFCRDNSVDFSILDSITHVKPNGSVNYFPKLAYFPQRNFKTIYFDGKNDERKLNDLAIPLRKMVKENDTINGLRFHFGKHCSYQTFISAQDLLFVNKAGCYFAYKNDIYTFEFHKKRSKLIPIGPIYGCSVDNTYWLEEERIRQRGLFIQNIKRFWQVPLALSGMILLNLFTLIKFNRNRIYNQKWYI